MAYNFDTSHDSPNYTPASQALAIFGYNRAYEGITIHWWGEGSPVYEGVRDYLCRQNGNTSAHYVATGTGRRVACIVSPADVAWATGSAYGNAKTISIECDPRMRDEDYDVVAELVADIRSAYGDIPLYWHYNWTATRCPDIYDVVRIDNLSYQKVSHDKWGDVTNKDVTVVAPQPSQPAPTAPTETLLYKVIKDSKQIGAFAKDINAWSLFTTENATSIKVNNVDVTDGLRAKFTTPSPTTQNPDGTTQPDSGKPVAEKDDFQEWVKTNVTQNNTLLQTILDLLKKLLSIFNLGGK